MNPPAKQKATTLRRYTNLAATIHLLQTKKITLLNPATWDDKNDAYFMSEYKRHKSAQSVLALCFAERAETYHHWRVFSHGTDGVRLEFDKDKIIAAFSADSRIRMGAVSCKKIDDLRSIKQIDLEDIPFLKREPFEDEGEYRVIYVDQNKTLERRDYDFSVSAIRRITLSPWMPKALANSVRSTLRSIEGCQHLNISHSQLIDSEQWKKLTAKVRSAKR